EEMLELAGMDTLPSFFEHLLLQKELLASCQEMLASIEDLPNLSPDHLMEKSKSMRTLLDEMIQAGGLAFEANALSKQITLVDDALNRAKASTHNNLFSLEQEMSSTLKGINYY